MNGRIGKLPSEGYEWHVNKKMVISHPQTYPGSTEATKKAPCIRQESDYVAHHAARLELSGCYTKGPIEPGFRRVAVMASLKGVR